MNEKYGLKHYPKKSTPQQYERFIKEVINDLEVERVMWNLYCMWGQPANMISIAARHRVILITQILGDGEQFMKKLPSQAKEMVKK